jgi:hypothetical protein
VLPPPVLEKMRFIHTVIDEITSNPAKRAEVGAPVDEQNQQRS